ncbi:hypothetical protein L218DRAFT_1078247 [Marasmius fiardii PR-910]|nr:hypothetical protein L218DRAFT_1078247 [Marasmius fiardii PR-910]
MMTIVQDLTFLKLALVLVSSLIFRQASTPPRNNSDSLSPSVVGKPQQMLVLLAKLPLPLYIVPLEIASLNEILFILHTEFREMKTPISTLLSRLDAFYPRLPEGSVNNSLLTWFLLKLLFLSLPIMGQLIRAACYRAFRGTFRFDLAAGGENRPLVTDGPYSVVRHPAYTGSWLIVIGIIGYHFSPGTWIHECLFGSLHHVDVPGSNWEYDMDPVVMMVWMWIGLILAVQVLLTLRTRDEDELLKGHFGDVWERWRSCVRYKLVPGVY